MDGGARGDHDLTANGEILEPGGPGFSAPPVAVNDGATVAEGGTVSVLDSGQTSVLFNDTDPENDPLTAILVSDVSNGTLTLNADGSFSYAHDGTATTTSDSFTYVANDGALDSEVATVAIEILP